MRKGYSTRLPSHNDNAAAKPYTSRMSFHVLILGGGFTGLEVARRLRKKGDVEVTLIDPESHALFTPRLVDALAKACSEPDLRASHEQIAQRRGYTFIQGKASAVDQTSKRVTVSLSNNKKKILSYDTLVCTYGAETNFYQLEGKEHTLPFKTWDHLLTIEEELPRLVRLKKKLNIAVIGGGATGMEITFALNKRLALLGCGPKQRAVTVFQAGPQILPGFLPKTIERTTQYLKESQIDLRLSTPVLSVGESDLTLQKGEKMDIDLVIWAAGIRPNTVEIDPPSTDQKDALAVEHTLRVAPNIFAGGDVIQFRDKQQIIPKNAQTALKMGAVIAKNILREREGKPLQSFRYHSLGVMLWLNDTAAFDLGGLSWFSPIIIWFRNQLYTQKWKKMSS